jgi:hypothetical protein
MRWPWQRTTVPAVPPQHAAELGGPLPGYDGGADLSRLPMQPMPSSLSTRPDRELTPQESLQAGLAYIRSRYGQITHHAH